MKSSVKNIESLTPLRGIAALLVAVFHFQIYFIRFTSPQESMFIDKGYLMVDLFFIMSGFLIMHVYKEDFAKSVRGTSYLKFIRARFARIYPLHLILLLLLVALFYIKSFNAGGYWEPNSIASHIFLLHSFPLNKDLTWNIPSWSISAEWWSYILFPFLSFTLSKNRKIAIGLMISVIILLYILLLFVVPRSYPLNLTSGTEYNLDITFDYGFVRSISGFMTGMLLYLVYLSDRIKEIFNSDLLCCLYILLLVVAMHKGISDICFIPGFSILILFLTSNTRKISFAFNNRVLTYLGDISYSVYMIHFLLIIFLEMGLSKLGYSHNAYKTLPFYTGLAICVAYVLTLLTLSAVSYKLVEKPCRNFINSKWAIREL